MKLREDLELNMWSFVGGERSAALSVNDLTASRMAQAPVTLRTFMALCRSFAENFKDSVSGSSNL